MQEILVYHNCLLAEPDKIDDWSKAIDLKDSNLANLISSNSYHELKQSYMAKRLEKKFL